MCSLNLVVLVNITGSNGNTLGTCESSFGIGCDTEEGSYTVYLSNGQLSYSKTVSQEEPSSDDDAVFCDPCKKTGGTYIGSFPELFTVGGRKSSRIVLTNFNISYIPENQANGTGKILVVSTANSSAVCCCHTSETDGTNEIKEQVSLTLDQLRQNISSSSNPDCDCGCPEGEVCVGAFENCGNLSAMLANILNEEKTNCIYEQKDGYPIYENNEWNFGD